MSPDALRLLARLHGVASWLATAALLGAVLAPLRAGLPPPRALARAAVAAVMVLAGVAAATGFALDAPYRARLRPLLFARAPAVGWLFERKEHLAFGALGLTLSAVTATAASALAARREGRSGGAPSPLTVALARSARWSWLAALLMAAAASIASAVVARHIGF